MTTAIGTSSGVGASSMWAATTPATKGTLDKDAFLKLLMAQIQHQDPTQPMEGTQLVTQLAQFTAVEQAVSQTQQLEMLSAQLTGLSANEAVNLIGKQVTVRGQTLNFDGSHAAGANVKLGAAAAEVTVSVTDASGNVLRSMKLGAKPAGPLSISWDGRDHNGQVVPAGAYAFRVEAVSATGAKVSVSNDVTGVVTQVSFDKGYPAVLLDSGTTASISDLISAGVAPVHP